MGLAARPGAASPNEAAVEAADPATRIERIVDRQVRWLGHPGMAVAVVQGDAVVFRKGYGLRNNRRADPVTPETVFRIGSITKVVAGLALLQLRDAGRLSLDDSIARFLPEAKNIIGWREAAPITLRHIVTHTSGLPRDLPSGGTTEADLLAKLRWLRVQTPPGTQLSYSNLAFAYVGPIVARASGVSFRDFVHAHLLAPLGMNDTVWERKDVDPKRLASGHVKVKEGERKDKVDPWPEEWKMGAAEAFGGLYSSADDLAKLVRFELSAWSASPETMAGVLARASLKESQSVALEPTHHGVAWALEDDARFGPRVLHTGATEDYSASVVMLPQKDLGVIVLSNFGPAPADVEAMTKRVTEKIAEGLR